MDENTVTPEKRCTKCGKHKPATPENFPRNAGKPGGFGTWCKACFNAIASAKRGPRKANPSTAERFWARIDKSGPIAPGMTSACWLSNSAKDRDGYAKFFVSEVGNNMGAHAYSWVLSNGEIAAGLQVNHLCHVRNCVNPSHLYLGTQADNIRDRDSRRKSRHVTQDGCPDTVGETDVR